MCSGRVYIRIASLGTTVEGKFGMELLVVGMGVGIILQHLEGMTLGSNEVDGNGLHLLMAASVDGDSSEIGTWVTPTMGTWGVPLSLMKLKLVL